MKTTERVDLVRAKCAEFPQMPNLTVARILYKEFRHLFNSLETARTAVRVVRGNRGSQNRKECKPDCYRPNGTSGFVWQFPKSSSPSYVPFVLDSPNTLILSDLHIPFHDTSAIMPIIEHAEKRNPDCILLNGDVCDFFSASRFDKNPTESSLKKELDLTRQFLGWLRQKFPKARIIYKLGNHDEWFDKYLHRKAPELYGVAGLDLQHLTTGLIEGKAHREPVGGIEWIDDQQKIKAGYLTIWHGHEIGKGSIAPPVNPARGLFMRTLDIGLMGHLHKDSMHSESTSNSKLVTCWSTGCLCGLHPRYARVNKWAQGGAWLELSGQSFSVKLLRVHNGKLL